MREFRFYDMQVKKASQNLSHGRHPFKPGFHRLACVVHERFVAMDVCSQRHAFIFMARDGLNGLQVYAFAVQGGQIRVPADVGRHAVYVDGALDPLPCALVRLFGVRCV